MSARRLEASRPIDELHSSPNQMRSDCRSPGPPASLARKAKNRAPAAAGSPEIHRDAEQQAYRNTTTITVTAFMRRGWTIPSIPESLPFTLRRPPPNTVERSLSDRFSSAEVVGELREPVD